MGGVQSKDIKNEKNDRNNKIESQLQRDRITAKYEVKMLLLDAEESGKSTLLKPMKLIHHAGFDQSERDLYKEVIFHEVIQSMRSILEAIPTLNLSLKPDNNAHSEFILSLPLKFKGNSFPLDVANAIRHLWRDPAVREAVIRLHDSESATYYFDSVDHMSAPDYVPSDQDILRHHVTTTGIAETTFRIGKLIYRVFDVAEQQSTLSKWLPCFDDISALIFLVSLSEYDQMSSEDRYLLVTQNRLKNAMLLFEMICNLRCFRTTNIILLLNNVDVFAKKLYHSPLVDYFSDYTGGDNCDVACDYLVDRFVSLNQAPKFHQIFAHCITATENDKLKDILSDTHHMLSRREIECFGRA